MKLIAALILAAVCCSVVAQDAPKARTVLKLSTKSASGEIVAEAIVDTNDAPDLAEWGKKAGGLCVEWFPKISALLPSEGFTPPKSVTLYFDPKLKGVAHADKGRITIGAEYVRGHTNDWGMVVHELTHIVQAYPKPEEKFTKPGWLVEGIADYIRLFHFEPNTPRPRINPDKASYRDAYKTTAVFIAWAEKKHDPKLVTKLNAALRQGKFSLELFKEATGKTVDELWGEFTSELRAKQGTPK